MVFASFAVSLVFVLLTAASLHAQASPLRRARIQINGPGLAGNGLTTSTVRSSRPDQQGTFQIKGLPAGEYLAVALEYVEDGAWNDPEYLESIRRYGRRIRLGESGTETVALQLVAPQ